jgi:hypothetical protein
LTAIIATLIIALLLPPPPSASPRAVFVGDSVTSAPDGYAAIVSDRYGWDAARFFYPHFGDALTLWHSVRAQRPDIVVVELGVHAIVGCDHLPGNDAELFRYYVGRVLDSALWTADAVVVLNIPWMGWGTALVKPAMLYNAIIADEASARGVPVADAWTAMIECGQACIGADGFHPNAAGHEAIADSVPDVTPVTYWAYLPIMRW